MSAGIRRNWTHGASVGLLLVAFGFLIFNAWAQSPTMDEQNHIARGYALLRTGDPRLSIEHPPLINLLEALPLLILRDRPRLPLDDWSWKAARWYDFAVRFMWQTNAQPNRIVFLARLPVIAMTLFLLAFAARWARELWGKAGGLLAMAFLALDPNLLAHGSLATTDLGITLTAFIAGYAVWRMCHALNVRSVLFAGLALGAMLASKTSAPMFLGVFGALFVGAAWQVGAPARKWHRIARRVGVYAAATLIAFLFLWAIYAFQVAPVVEGGAALPMGTYWQGILAVFNNVQGGQPSYLLGETILGGWPFYFPITFTVKTPLPTLLCLLVAMPASVRRKRWRATLFLLVPVAVYWAFVLYSSLNLGYRHLLPTLPFLLVWAAQVGGTGPFRRQGAARQWRLNSARIASGLFVWLVIETLWIAPHFLAYFNPIGGGPENGWKIIADSNIDWGQDLKYVCDYVARAQLVDYKLSWFGTAPPAAYGLVYEPLPGHPHHFDLWFEPATFNEQQPEPGFYIISVSNLVELPLDKKHFFAYFRDREPDVRIGYSVYVYEVKEP